MFGEPDEYLFHYTTLAVALEHILEKATIRLSPFSAMRDPRESQAWLITGGGYGGVDEAQYQEYSKKMNALKHEHKLLSLTQDDLSRHHSDEDPVYRRGFARPRLWEQYAQSHRGVCLCFNRETLIESLCGQLGTPERPLTHGAVEYRDDRLGQELFVDLTPDLGVDELVEANLDRYFDALFLTKLRDWETENEYRFVVRTDKQGYEFASIETSLRAVCLGGEVARTYVPSFTALCEGRGWEVLQMRWENGYPRIRTIPNAGY